MNCSQARETLPLHLAGELEDDAEFQAHLALCEGCARRAELSAVVWDLAGKAPEMPVPEAAIRGVYDGIERSRRRPQRMFLTLLRLGTVAAAALIGALFLGRPGRPPEPPYLMAPDDPPSAYFEPAFGRLEARGERAEEGPLALKSHSVTVEVRDWVARTEVEEVFVNSSDRRLEGTFIFPLPPDASLSRFAMDVNGTLVEGEVVERVRAREVYEGIVRRMQDPALLEWMPGNLFKARIFPIEPRSEKRVILAYTQAPRFWSGALSYVYPLVSEKTQTHPPGELSIRATFRFSRPIRRIESPTHRADVARRDERSARVTLLLRNERPRSDFQVRAEVEPEELVAASHAPAGEEGYLGVAFAPRFEGGEAPAGTYVFVVDRSARMNEGELRVARDLVDRMIGRLREGDRAGIVAHHVDVLARAPEPVTPDRRRELRDFLWALPGEGASDVALALRRAAEAAGEGGTVVYIGKGVPTWGETELGRAAEALRGRLFRAVLVGTGANEAGLGPLAREGGLQAIAPGGDTAAEIAAIARTAAVRPIRELEVALEGVPLSGIVGQEGRAVYPGERVTFFARYPAGAARRATLVVRGVVGGRRVERRTEVDLAGEPTEHGYLARLWGQWELARRVAECQRSGEPAAEVAAIVEMSRRYQLMTPYTSFLVLESEEAYKQHRIERARRREEEARQEAEQKRRLEKEQAKQEAERIAVELARGRTIEERQKFHQSEEHYKLALEHLRKGELDQAGARAEKAVESWSENIAARRLAEQVRSLSAAPAEEREKRRWVVQIEQAQIEITKHVRDGERYLAARMHDQALKEFEHAEFKIAHIPYDVKAMQDLLPRVRDALVKAKNAKILEERRVEDEKRRHAEAEASASGPRAGREWEDLLRKLKESHAAGDQARSSQADEHYRLAERYYAQGDFEKAELESQKALKLNPDHASAKALELETLFLLGRGKATPQNQEYDKYIREAVVRHSQTLGEVDDALQRGVRFHNRGDHDAAEREFRKVLEYAKWMPTGVELEARRKQALEMLGRAGEAPRDRGRRLIDAGRGAELLFGQALLHFEREEYARAAELSERILAVNPHLTTAAEMRNVARRLQHMKAGRDNVKRYVEDWKRTYEATELAGVVQADDLEFTDREAWLNLVARRGDAEKRRMAEGEASLHEVGTRREVTRRMAFLLDLSYQAFEQKRYDRAAKLADELLEIDPNYTVARELKEDALKVRHKEQYHDVLARKVEAWRRLTDSDKDAAIPWSQTVRFPNRAEWAEISKRITESIIKHEGGLDSDEDPDILAIHRKLDTMKIDMSFDHSKLEDILAFMRDFTGLNILLDVSVRDQVEVERDLSLKLRDVVLKNALKLLLEPFGLQYVVTEDKVVLLTRGGERVVLKLYDVQDITYGMQDFPGVDLTLAREPAGETPPGPGRGAEKVFTGEDLALRVKERVGKDAWNEADGKSIQFNNGLLIVRNTAEAHARVRAFLAELRARDEGDEERLKLELYDVGDFDEKVKQRLVEDLKAITGEAAWKGEGRSIELRENLLVVRQTKAVHEALRQFLIDLRLKRTGLREIEAQQELLRRKLEAMR